MKTKAISTLKLCAVSLGLLCGAANAAVVADYSDFSSTAGLTLVGDASTAATGGGTVLRINPAATGRSGAFYSTSAITLGANATFSTSFQFRMTSPGGIDPADGFVFVLAKSATGLGGAGGGIGYQNVANSIGIEFDTYNNGGYDNNSSNHLGVDTNGSVSSQYIKNIYNKQTCDFGVATPYSAAGCMSNGDLWTVTIGYDGTNLSVNLLDPSMGVTFNAVSNYAINIASILGTNQAFAGFTAATGSGYENHDIVNWHFANTTELAADVPEPGTLALLGLGLAGLALRKRKSTSV